MGAKQIPALVVRWAAANDLSRALACYERNGYAGGIRPQDRVLVAERDGMVVGVVRLVDELGHRLLRGMFLDAAERGRGLGGRMLAAITRELNEGTCWLICGQHLAPFYGRVSFEVVPDAEAPAHLPPRAAGYSQRHGPQVIMRRRGR